MGDCILYTIDDAPYESRKEIDFFITWKAAGRIIFIFRQPRVKKISLSMKLLDRRTDCLIAKNKYIV